MISLYFILSSILRKEKILGSREHIFIQDQSNNSCILQEIKKMVNILFIFIVMSKIHVLLELSK